MNNTHRLLFSKTGRACYVSHLDLMRTFPRVFLRAEVPVRYSEGFNPHANFSIALPLSLGYSSDCELLELSLLGDIPAEEVPERLNKVMPEGLRAIACYPTETAMKKLADIDWTVTMDFDGGIPDGAEGKFAELLGRESHVVQKPSKKAKRGYVELDIVPLVKRWALEREGDRLVLRAALCAQNPGLNPEVLINAVVAEYPELKPDFVRCHRNELLNADGAVFR